MGSGTVIRMKSEIAVLGSIPEWFYFVLIYFICPFRTWANIKASYHCWSLAVFLCLLRFPPPFQSYMHTRSSGRRMDASPISLFSQHTLWSLSIQSPASSLNFSCFFRLLFLTFYRALPLRSHWTNSLWNASNHHTTAIAFISCQTGLSCFEIILILGDGKYRI